MKINHLFLFAAIAISSGAVNEVSAQTNWSTQQVVAVSTAEINTRVTPDLAFFNLHGPVKTLKDEDGKTWEFTPEGNLKTTPSNFTRDSEGYIVMKTVDLGEEVPNVLTYKYNDKMQIYHMDLDGYELGGRRYLIYDDSGIVIGEYSEYEYDELTVNMTKYVYTKTDKYGNWITRNWSITSISYDTGEGEKPSFKPTGNPIFEGIETGTHYRTITYYE